MERTTLGRFAAALIGSAMLTAGTTVLAQPADRPAGSPVANAADEKAIRDNAASYAAAFNSRDAKLMSSLWSPEAVYTNRATGEQVVGRDAIAKQIEGLLKTAGKSTMQVVVDKVEFVSPNVAIERGTSRLVPEKGTPEEITYTAVEVKREGRWLLDRVTEESGPVASPARAQLQQLAWLVGAWKDEDPDSQMEFECKWAKNENFLVLAFKGSVAGRTQMAGMQIIGYDAGKKQFRSWVFDSDGAFGEGTWQQKGKQSFIHQKGTLPDGRSSSAVNIIRQLDDKSFTWQSTNREIDGRIEPNVDELRFVRANQ